MSDIGIRGVGWVCVCVCVCVHGWLKPTVIDALSVCWEWD